VETLAVQSARAVLIAAKIVAAILVAGDFRRGSDSLLALIQLSRTARHRCVFCYFCLEKLTKQEGNVGYFDNGSKTYEKKILVCTRTPESRDKSY
jgi:hypothetical protein